MRTAAQRAEKRRLREGRASKVDTWYCAGCKERHPVGQKCPAPRLFAKTNRLRTYERALIP